MYCCTFPLEILLFNRPLTRAFYIALMLEANRLSRRMRIWQLWSPFNPPHGTVLVSQIDFEYARFSCIYVYFIQKGNNRFTQWDVLVFSFNQFIPLNQLKLNNAKHVLRICFKGELFICPIYTFLATKCTCFSPLIMRQNYYILGITTGYINVTVQLLER